MNQGYNLVAVSYDVGASWHVIAENNTDGSTKIGTIDDRLGALVASNNGRILWEIVADYVSASTDGGHNWFVVLPSPVIGTATELVPIGPQGAMLLDRGQRTLLTTVDGLHWHDV